VLIILGKLSGIPKPDKITFYNSSARQYDKLVSHGVCSLNNGQVPVKHVFLPIRLKRRLKELKDERERGQNMLNEHDAKR
jgi:hypothetical protein